MGSRATGTGPSASGKISRQKAGGSEDSKVSEQPLSRIPIRGPSISEGPARPDRKMDTSRWAANPAACRFDTPCRRPSTVPSTHRSPRPHRCLPYRPTRRKPPAVSSVRQEASRSGRWKAGACPHGIPESRVNGKMETTLERSRIGGHPQSPKNPLGTLKTADLRRIFDNWKKLLTERNWYVTGNSYEQDPEACLRF